MKINGRFAEKVKFHSGAYPKIIAARPFCRLMKNAVDDNRGSLDILSFFAYGRLGDENMTHNKGCRKAKFDMMDELQWPEPGIFFSMEDLVITFYYKEKDYASFSELYRTGKILENINRLMYKFASFKIYIGNSTEEYYVPELYWKDTHRLNDAFIIKLDELINKPNEDYLVRLQKLEKFSHEGNMDHILLGIFHAVGYDFRKHNIVISDNRDRMKVTLRIPEGKSAYDTEVTKVYNIFRNYVYPEENGCKPKFVLVVEGELIKTRPQLWEKDQDFVIRHSEEK